LALKLVLAGMGPTAVIATKMLLQLGHEVSVIDSSSIKNETNLFLSKAILKDRETKRHIYLNASPIPHEEGRGVSILETRSRGGLSNIWGGVFLPSLGDYFEKEHKINRETYYRVLKELECSLVVEPFPILDWRSDGYSELLESDSMQPRMALDKMGEIWSADNFWSSFSHPNLRIISGVLQKFEVRGATVFSQIVGDTTVETIDSDFLFLACGPIGNAKIILNSENHNSHLELRDSAVIYFPVIDLKKRLKPEIKMRPEKVGATLTQGQPKIFWQVYELSEQLISSLRSMSLRSLIRVINKIIGYRLNLLMVFLNSENSNQLKLEKNKDVIYLSQEKRMKRVKPREFLKLWRKILWSEYKLIIPMWMKGKTGEGAHLSGDGSLSFERVKPLGMSISKEVLAGPVTFLSMALTLQAIDDFASQNN
jgi:hypothetical protein